MVRFDDWPARLSNYLTLRKAMPFEWGVNDCVYFAMKGVCAIAGKDFTVDYPSYSTEQAANIIISANGCIASMVSKHLGNPHDDVNKAQRGDVVLVKYPTYALGLVDDTGYRIAMVTYNGLVRIPIRHARAVWSY